MPETPTLRPRSVGSPHRCFALARMPWKTPKEVSTEESPAPPFSGERPVTQRQVREITSMSCT